MKNVSTLLFQITLTFRQHLYLIVFFIIYISASAAITSLTSFPIADISTILGMLTFYLGLCLGFFLAHTLWVILAIRPQHPIHTLRTRIREHLTKDRWLTALPVLVIVGPFGIAFTRMKSLIPIFHPFAWDTYFATLDQWLHFGYQPWQWLAPLLLNGPIVSVVSLIYTELWPLVGFAVLAYATFDTTRPNLRMQFLLTYFGCWGILGTVAAIALSSAGPVYYQYFGTPEGLFIPLLDQLTHLDNAGWLTPKPTMELLWTAYQAPGIAPGGLGISAMPSVHVALAFLFFLYARHYGGIPKILSAIFVTVILIGSVLLGWHYAIDGYVAIICTLILWRIAGHISGTEIKWGTSIS